MTDNIQAGEGFIPNEMEAFEKAFPKVAVVADTATGPDKTVAVVIENPHAIPAPVMTPESVLEGLGELYSYRDALSLQKAEAMKAVIPAEVQQAIDDVTAEFSPIENALNERIQDLEIGVKEMALNASATVQTDYWQVVYTRPGYTVSTKDVLSLANRWEKTNPDVAAEIRSILGVSKAKVSIQPRKVGK